MRVLVGVLACVAAAAALAQVKSDWERENEDRLKQSQEQVVPPPAFDRSRLTEVNLEAPSSFRFFVDPQSVSVGEDRIVRYVLVARSPSGVENIRFEGMRCPGEYRVYAVAGTDGGWGGRPGQWQAIPRDARLAQHALSRRYFCPGREAIGDGAEGAMAVKNGGHPWLVRGQELGPGR